MQTHCRCTPAAAKGRENPAAYGCFIGPGYREEKVERGRRYGRKDEKCIICVLAPDGIRFGRAQLPGNPLVRD